MTIPITPVSLNNVQNEFGGANPISLSEYYRGGIYVPATQGDAGYGIIPTAGAISLLPFRNQTKVINLAINVQSVGTYNIFTQAGSPAGPVNVVLTIAGVYLYAPNTSSWALDTGAGWHASSTIRINNSGAVVGHGGAGGGSPSAPGGVGGPAFRAQRAVTIYNYNAFGGGGGGGGASGGYDYAKIRIAQGGGGGGRALGAGGAGNFSGASGTLTAAGAGGSGADHPTLIRGGNGGDLGVAGETAPLFQYAGGAGGAAGSCTNGNGFITWAVVGNRYGALN